MKTENQTMLMSEESRAMTGQQVFRQVEVFWLVMLVFVGLLAIFSREQFPQAGKGDAQIASAIPAGETRSTGNSRASSLKVLLGREVISDLPN